MQPRTTPPHAPPEFNVRGLSGTRADIAANERLYYLSAMETLDTELGGLLDSLHPVTRDNTIIMVVGDNGNPRDLLDTNAFLPSLQKGGLFDGGVRVPLEISDVGITRSHERESGLVSVVDFFPTINMTTGTDIFEMHDGVNFQSTFNRSEGTVREFMHTDYMGNNALGRWAVRSSFLE